MERDCHDSIGSVERLFYSIAVVYIDINVKDSVVVLEELEDRKHDVVHIAEARRFLLLGVV